MVRGFGLTIVIAGLCAASAAQAAGVRVERTPDGIPYVVGDPTPQPSGPTSSTPAVAKPEKSDFGIKLSERIEQAFVGEFADQETARAVWRRVAAPAFLIVGDDMYPKPDPEAFAAQATTELKAQRAADPSLSVEQLAAAAMNPGKAGLWVTSFDGPPTKALKDVPERVVLRTVKGVNVLRISSFNSETAHGVDEALIAARGPLIIDLRGNEGGLLDAMIDVGSRLVDERAVLFTVEERAGPNEYRVRSRPEGVPAPPSDIIALVDRGTNSGALLFAAMLVDLAKARVAGTAIEKPSGLVFSVRPAPSWRDEGKPAARVIRYPTGILKRPNGAPISAGLRVDIPAAAAGDKAIEAAIKAFAEPKSP